MEDIKYTYTLQMLTDRWNDSVTFDTYQQAVDYFKKETLWNMLHDYKIGYRIIRKEVAE